jgi:hypothetical protein
MKGTKFTALCGPQRAETRDRALDAIIRVAWQETGNRLLVVDLDPLFSPVSRTIRGAKDGIKRYARTVAWGDVPYVEADGAMDFFTELLKRRETNALSGYQVAVIAHDPRIGNLFRAMDHVAYLVNNDSSALPWLFPILKHMGDDKSFRASSVILTDESMIEKAAMGFQSIKGELSSALGASAAIGFGGFIKFDPEKALLASSSGIPYLELFSGQGEHGQAKAIYKRLFTEDEARSGEELDRVLRFLVGEGEEAF